MAADIAGDGCVPTTRSSGTLWSRQHRQAGRARDLEVTGVGDAELILIEVPWGSVQSACGPDSLRGGPRLLGML